AGGDGAEERVPAVEVRLRRNGDEELAPARVLSRVRHPDGAPAVGPLADLAAEGVAGPAVAVAAGAAALHDEAGLHTMEGEAVVEAAAREVEERGHREGRLHDVEMELDRAVAGEEKGPRG